MTSSLQVKKGKFYVVLYDREGIDGKNYKWIPTGLPVKNNKHNADEMRKRLHAEYEEQKPILSSKMLFSDFIVEWLALAKTTVRSNTYLAYKDTAYLHVIPYFKALKLSIPDVKPIHIQKYFIEKVTGTDGKKGLSPNTLAKHKTVINETLKYALKQDYIRDGSCLKTVKKIT